MPVMNNSYSELSLAQQPLVDLDQWASLHRELGSEMLLGFVAEFFAETAELWLNKPLDLQTMDQSAFRSLAHRTAGVAGTIGFVKLRHVFLCMEYNPVLSDTQRYWEPMRAIVDQTKLWVQLQH